MAAHSLIALSNTTATALTPVHTYSGMDLTIQNVNATGYIYVGATSSVSSTDYGFRIMPNHSISFELTGRDFIYVIASATSMSAAVIKTSLESGQ